MKGEETMNSEKRIHIDDTNMDFSIVSYSRPFEFKPWGGAVQHMQDIRDYSDTLLEEIFAQIADICGETDEEGRKTVDETTLNDMFWFEPETLLGWVGYKYAEATGKIVPKDEDEDEE